MPRRGRCNKIQRRDTKRFLSLYQHTTLNTNNLVTCNNVTKFSDDFLPHRQIRISLREREAMKKGYLSLTLHLK